MLIRSFAFGLLVASMGCAVDRSGLGSDDPKGPAEDASVDGASVVPDPPRSDAAVSRADARPAPARDAATDDASDADASDADASDADASDADASTECGRYIVPAVTTPTCDPAVGLCMRACADGTCARGCIDTTLTGAEHTGCVRCYERTQMRCANELSCQDRYDEVLCCLDRWCGETDADCRDEVLGTVCAPPWDAYKECYFANESACLWRVSVCVSE